MDKLAPGYWNDIKLGHERYWNAAQVQPKAEELMESLGHPCSAAYREMRDVFDTLPFACNLGGRVWFFHQQAAWSRPEVYIELWRPELRLSTAPAGACKKFNDSTERLLLLPNGLSRHEAAYIRHAAKVGWDGAEPMMSFPLVRFMGAPAVLEQLRALNNERGGTLDFLSNAYAGDSSASIYCASIEDWRMVREFFERTYGPGAGQLPTAQTLKTFHKVDKRLENATVEFYDGNIVVQEGSIVRIPRSAVAASEDSDEFQLMCDALVALVLKGLSIRKVNVYLASHRPLRETAEEA